MPATSFEGNGHEDNSGRLYIKFSLEPLQNEQKTIEAGMPIFDDVEHITKMVPGDKTSVIKRPVRPEDRVEFRTAYEAFKSGNQNAITGFALSEWTPATRGQVETLSFANCKTVEQLAQMPDGNLQQLGPGYLALRQKARDFIEAAKGNAPMEKVRAENLELKNEIEVLRRNVNQLMEAQAKESKSKK